MSSNKYLAALVATIALTSGILTAAEPGTEKVLHVFDGTDGANSTAALIFDSKGNLFGTTNKGGNYNQVCGGGCGTVFELSPAANGKWAEKVLYRFCSVEHCGDGSAPGAGGLIFDAAGNLYGTTYQGGGESCSGGCGTVFKLSPGTNGGWTETVLYAFSGKDGSAPHSNLIFDGSGNLYGTTSAGSARGYGNAFRLTRGADGKWTEKVLHIFSITSGPSLSGLIFDSAGDLYGTTSSQGGKTFGSVFSLAPGQNGKWTYTALHIFYAKYAATPLAGVIFDAAGNLYGTTVAIDGSVFELSPDTNGVWMLRILHFFNERNGGYSPFAGLTLDPAGNLYGTAFQGGDYGGNCSQGGSGCGVIFEVTP